MINVKKKTKRIKIEKFVLAFFILLPALSVINIFQSSELQFLNMVVIIAFFVGAFVLFAWIV